MNLPMLAKDKANHALYGAVIFLVAGAVATAAGAGSLARPIAAAAAVAVGVLKEAADYLANRRAIAAGLPPPHGVEALDATATSAGAFLCWVAAAATEA